MLKLTKDYIISKGWVLFKFQEDTNINNAFIFNKDNYYLIAKGIATQFFFIELILIDPSTPSPIIEKYMPMPELFKVTLPCSTTISFDFITSLLNV